MTADPGLVAFQRVIARTAGYEGRGTPVGAMYAALGLASEAGEVGDQVKNAWRWDGGEVSPGRRVAVERQLGHLLRYAALLAEETGVSLGAAAVRTLEEFAERRAENA